jgi:two-component system response regulator YesN
MKILIIDDNLSDRQLIISHIETKGNKNEIITDESSCLKDAMKKLKTDNYDAIILDTLLPESSGIETIKTVMSVLKNLKKNIPVIVITATEDYKIGREAWLLGVKEYIIKNEMQPEDLMRALNFATYSHKND